MSVVRTQARRTFETFCDVVEVTSIRRPDTSWRKVDQLGHSHCWYTDGAPADSYRPDHCYVTPSLVWVKDGETFYEDDDEPHDVGHLECRECGEKIEPGYTADTMSQHIPGMRRFRIDGVSVSEEEFRRQWDLQS
ncbi:MAG: hypothetical protein NUW22_12300 [Acidobacteria bacterium]|nr:hypothetical protein [Acidobacteriota bacterium]